VPELEPGNEFAGCRIEAVAGRGGMGVVYRATELSLGRPVALKLLPPERAGDQEFRERFQRESRMAASIDHPNVVPVYAAGEHDGSLYLVMRYVGGTDLHALLREEGRLEPARAAELVAQLASALDAAHAAGLVHRDVKPANVLLADDDHAYLSDFGLTRLAGSEASLTASGQWIGTVEYCSPEQLQGGRTDARADVYSLGCVLFAALCGRPPFAQGTVTATMLAHLNDQPPMPSSLGAPHEFDRVIARALAKRPEDRYPSAGDLGRAALAAARGEAVTESERSVAIGSAAPEHGGNGDSTAVLRPDETAVTRWDPHEGMTAMAPESQARTEAGERRVVKPRRWPARMIVGFAGFLGLVAVGLGLGLVFGDPGGAGARSGALTEDEVREVAYAFADAYAAEDPAALRATLARNVERTAPGGVSRGRDAVVDQYERQFDGKVGSYELDDLDVQAGRGGRAAGTYHVERESGDPYDGSIVFGVVRERGEPRIALIAFTPSS
jgi:serine/threonine-protein kinase